MRCQSLLEQHVGKIALEDLALAALKVVAIRKDDAVIVGQQHASVRDRIQPARLLDLVVVDDVAKILFLVRTDFQQDQVADDDDGE